MICPQFKLSLEISLGWHDNFSALFNFLLLKCPGWSEQPKPEGHFWSINQVEVKRSAGRDTILYLLIVLSWYEVCSPHKADRKPPQALCLCHADSRHTSPLNHVFSAILLISLRSLVIWNFSVLVVHAYVPLLLCLFALSPWKRQSFGENPWLSGWAVFTVSAPLCVFHSNCLRCQDVTKQTSHEMEGGKKLVT